MLVVSRRIIVIIICTLESARFGLSVVFFFICHAGGVAVTRGFERIRKNGLGRHIGLLCICRYSYFVLVGFCTVGENSTSNVTEGQAI